MYYDGRDASKHVNALWYSQINVVNTELMECLLTALVHGEKLIFQHNICEKKIKIHVGNRRLHSHCYRIFWAFCHLIRQSKYAGKRQCCSIMQTEQVTGKKKQFQGTTNIWLKADGPK